MAGNPDFSSVYQAAGQEWNVDPSLIAAVAGQEGGGTSNVSSAGAQGHMQLMPKTAQGLGVTDMNDPVQSIYGGAKYLSQMLDRYQSTPQPVENALAAYNAGPQRVDDYLAGRSGLPAETVAYVPGVARRYQALAGNTAQQQPAATGASSPDPATANLDARMAQLRGASQTVPAPTTTPAAPTDAVAGSDPFSQAVRAAQGLSGASGAASGQPTAQQASSASQPPATGATGSGGAPDYFAQALAASQRATTAPGAASGAVTPASMPGTAQPAPAAPTTAAGPASDIAHAVGQQVGNFMQGAGHAVLDASHGLYGLLNRAEGLAPGLNDLDRATGMNPPAALANLDAQAKQYTAADYGDTLAGKAGDIAAQTVMTLPALAGVGGAAAAAARGIAAGADAISPALGRGVQFVNRLMGGTASVPDNALANAAVRPVSLAANGAAQGAVAGAVTGDPNQGVVPNMLTGAEAGAVLGPAAGAVAAGANRLVTGAKALVQPFTEGGRNAIADNALAKLALGGPLASDTTAYVPNSTPTLAQATGNPGLAGAERAVASIRPNEFSNKAAVNQDARENMLTGLTGTPADIDKAVTARDATALPGITGPIANATGPAVAAPVVSAIDQILASPAGQRDAVTSALGNIRSKLVTPIPFGDRVDTALNSVTGAINSGNVDPGLWAAREALLAAQKGGAQQASTLARLAGTSSMDPAAQAVIDGARQTVGTAERLETNPAQLYGIRKAIGDSLSPLSARAGSDAQLASSELQQVKGVLDDAIEGAAPGFKAGVAGYSAASNPINAMSYLQGRGYTSADGTITLAKVQSALDDIVKQQGLPGARNAKAIPQDTIDGLTGLRNDLLRQNNSRLGMQPGSNTFQQLAVNNALAGAGAPAAFGARLLSGVPVIGNMLTGSVGRAYAAQNEPILNAVVNKLANPDAGASVLERARTLMRQRAAGPAGANAAVVLPGVNLLTGAGR